MKTSSLVVALLLLVAISSNALSGDSDNVIVRSLLIGDWTLEPNAKSKNPPLYSSYRPDGTYDFFVFENDCKTIKFSSKGVWALVGTKLITQTREVSDTNTPVQAGMKFTDDILEISDHAFTLRTKSGLIYRVVRGRPCN